jgi:transposase InsO family protein
MRDVFVCGVYNDRIGERLLAEDAKKLTFEVAVTKSEIIERSISDRSGVTDKKVHAVQNNQRHMAKENGPPRPQLQASHHKHAHSSNYTPTKKKPADTQGEVRCFRCDRLGHRANAPDCPALKKTCKNCGRMGHFSRRCKFPPKPVHLVEGDKEDDEDSGAEDAPVHYVYKDDGDSAVSIFKVGSLRTVNVEIDGIERSCIPDTGAAINVLPEHLAVPPFKPTKEVLRTYGGHPLPVVGETTTTVRYNGHKASARFIVVTAPREKPLLCTETCTALGLLHEVATVLPTNLRRQFGKLFEGIGLISEPCKIYVEEGAVPRNFPFRRLPPALLEPITKTLQEMEKQGIIAPAEQVEWCAPIVPVKKKDGTVRICVDFRLLNKVVVRQPFQMPSLEDILTQLSGAKVFSALDARSGYYQIQVDAASQKYLGFNTPIGRYKFLRLPFGICSAPEIYQRTMQTILKGLSGCLVYLDDILVFGKDDQEHDARLFAVLKRLQEHNVHLNDEKCVFSASELPYLGHIFSADGVRPQDSKLSALSEFPIPQSTKDVRSFLGLAEYTAHKFVPNYSELSSPLWALTKTEEFTWTTEAQTAFRELQKAFTKIRPLQFYAVDKDVVVRTDASGIGLGAILEQDGRPVLFASRKLTDCETRYSQIEREFLAIVFAMTRFRNFVLGKKVLVKTDNKPLISHFRKDMDSLPLRIRKWMLALQPYTFTLEHVSARRNIPADTLSRYPAEEDVSEAEYAGDTICLVMGEAPLSFEEILEQSQLDHELIAIKHAVMANQWTKVDETLKPFFPVRNNITLDDSGMVLYQDRIILPVSLRAKALTQVHEGHRGTQKMLETLRGFFYWPGLQEDVRRITADCQACVTFARANKAAPLHPVADVASQPWHMIALDFTGGTNELNGNVYLTVIDYYSRYPYAFEVKTTSGEEVVKHLKSLFAMNGFPRIVVCDNGPAFIGEVFLSFLKRAGVQVKHSSTYFPQGNGVVERLHGTFKGRIRKMLHEGTTITTAVNQSLFDIRSSTNDSTGCTPFFLFYGRDMPTRWQGVTTSQVAKPPRALHDEYIKRNRRRHNKFIPFHVGDEVMIANGQGCQFRHRCIVQEQLGHGAWLVRHGHGRTQTVNQRFMRLFRPCDLPPPPPGVDVDDQVPAPQGRYSMRGNRPPMEAYRD